MAEPSALDGLDPATLEAAGEDPVLLGERPFRTRLLLRGRLEALSAAGASLELDLPSRVGGTATRGTLAALWLGPDRIALLDEPGRERALLARLEAALANLPGAIVDLGEAMTTFRLEGPAMAVRATLAEGCPLDLHPRSAPAGSAFASHYGKVAIWLHLLAAAPDRCSAELHVERSFARHLARHLALAGREHGFRLERRARSLSA